MTPQEAMKLVLELAEENSLSDDEANTPELGAEALRQTKAIEMVIEYTEDLEEVLRRILAWCDAYPTSVFIPISDENMKLADVVLAGAGISMTGMHGQWGRHILAGIRDMIKMVLP